jgi:ATP-dependent Lon protease
VEIAMKHLLPRRREWAAFDPEELIVDIGVIEALADACTEAGVRWLDHQLSKLVSAAASRAVRTGETPQHVRVSDLVSLGVEVDRGASGVQWLAPGEALTMARNSNADWVPTSVQVRVTGNGGTITITPSKLGAETIDEIALAVSVVRSHREELALPIAACSASYHIHFRGDARTVSSAPVAANAGPAIVSALVSLWNDTSTQSAVTIARLELDGSLGCVVGADEIAAAAGRHHIPTILLPRETPFRSGSPNIAGAEIRFVGKIGDIAMPAITKSVTTRTKSFAYL